MFAGHTGWPGGSCPACPAPSLLARPGSISTQSPQLCSRRLCRSRSPSSPGLDFHILIAWRSQPTSRRAPDLTPAQHLAALWEKRLHMGPPSSSILPSPSTLSSPPRLSIINRHQNRDGKVCKRELQPPLPLRLLGSVTRAHSIPWVGLGGAGTACGVLAAVPACELPPSSSAQLRLRRSLSPVRNELLSHHRDQKMSFSPITMTKK